MNARDPLVCCAVLFLLGGAAFAQEMDPPKTPGEPAGATATADPRAAAAERVKRLEGELEAIRGKKFKHDVGVETQTADEFRRFIEQELDSDLPPAKARAMSRSLQLLGLLPKDYDLRKGLADLYVSQAGAYYNPKTQKFYVLMADMPDAIMEPTIVHELMHALQDQYFDLAPMFKKIGAAKSDDASSAFQFLVEGEATCVQLEFQLKQAGAQGPMAEMALTQTRDMTREALDQQAGMVIPMLGEGAEPIKKAIAALKDMPGYLFWSLHAPYLRGQWAVHAVAKAKGWTAVDGLYRDPPQATELMMQPEKLLAPKHEMPAPVAIDEASVAAALGDDWKPLYANELGELGVFILLDQDLPEAARGRSLKIANAWRGDRYATFEATDGRTGIIWELVFADAAGAKAFAEAAKGFRWPAKEVVTQSDDHVWIDVLPEDRRSAALSGAGLKESR